MADNTGLLSGKLNSGLFLSDPLPPKGGLNFVIEIELAATEFRSPLGDLGVREFHNHNTSCKIYD
jgi:hypothetical protein